MDGILGMIELLIGTDLSEEQRNTVRIIQTSADGLLRILNDVLDVSKMEAGRLDLESIDFHVPELLHETAHIFAPTAAGKGLELLVNVGDGVPTHTWGDPVRLRQIIANLLSNAVKFTKDGEIVLSADRIDEGTESNRIRLSVRDTGIGVPESKQEAIFREFEQADQSTTRVHGGTGLGLTISRRLAEMMGGSLELTSDAGAGSDFSFVLSLNEAVDVRSNGRRAPRVSLRDRRVLIVDDNATAGRISRQALAAAGATADEADSADEGIAPLRAAMEGQPYDAVILDHLMPAKDGFDFAREVRTEEGFAGLPILMLTSSAAASGQVAAREVRSGVYLAKPVFRQQLTLALSSMLGPRPPDGLERRLITGETLQRRVSALRVLLAEDNLVNQQVELALLQNRGHTVEVVADGQQALEAAIARSFDIVLMDIQMPVMDGLEATRRIREHPGLEGLPIIALTAHAFQEERDRTVTADMNDFLAKPFKPQALYEIVERWAPAGAAVDVNEDSPEDHHMEGADTTPPVDIEGFRAMMREVGIEEVVDATLTI